MVEKKLELALIFKSGKRIEYQCEPASSVMVGNSELTCDNGTWNHSPPTCKGTHRHVTRLPLLKVNVTTSTFSLLLRLKMFTILSSTNWDLAQFGHPDRCVILAVIHVLSTCSVCACVRVCVAWKHTPDQVTALGCYSCQTSPNYIYLFTSLLRGSGRYQKW